MHLYIHQTYYRGTSEEAGICPHLLSHMLFYNFHSCYLHFHDVVLVNYLFYFSPLNTYLINLTMRTLPQKVVQIYSKQTMKDGLHLTVSTVAEKTNKQEAAILIQHHGYA